MSGHHVSKILANVLTRLARVDPKDRQQVLTDLTKQLGSAPIASLAQSLPAVPDGGDAGDPGDTDQHGPIKGGVPAALFVANHVFHVEVVNSLDPKLPSTIAAKEHLKRSEAALARLLSGVDNPVPKGG